MTKNKDEMNIDLMAYWVKNKNKTEIIYSILCAGITILYFKTKFLYYPFAFIGFDILTIVCHKISNGIFRIFWNSKDLYSKQSFLRNQIEELNSWYTNSDKNRELKSDAKYKLSDILEDINNKIKEEETDATEEKEAKENLEVAAFNNELKIFKQTTKVLKTAENEEMFKNLYSKLKDIILLIKEKPATSVFANKIFNLYIPEIVVLINNYPQEETLKEEHTNKLIDIINEIDVLATNTKKTIENYNQKNVEISFEVLKREIRKSGEELED